MIYFGCGDGKIKRFSGQDSTWYKGGEVQINGEVMSISCHPQGKNIVVGSKQGIIYIINTTDLSIEILSESHIAPVTCNDFGVLYKYIYQISNDLIATGSLDGSIKLWDLNNYKNVVNIQQHCECLCLAYTKSDLICSGWKDQFIRVFHARDGVLFIYFYQRMMFNIPNAHRSPITAIAANESYFKYILE